MEAVSDKTDTRSAQDKDIGWFFDLALILKLINGGLEVLVGFLVLFVRPTLVVRLTEFITSGELAQDPNDLVANTLRNAAHSFAIHTHYLVTLYLVLHGGVKILLVIGIFMKKKIAYPLFMLALAIFGTYEAYRGFARHEILLQALAVFDFCVLILTSYEYRRRYRGAVTPSFLAR
jgi:uncharacterized membrane protein